MNALLVLFFLAIILNDYFYKEGYFVKVFLTLFSGYLVIYIFTNKSTHHNPYKNLLLAIFSQSYDPTVYAKLEFNVAKAKEYIADYEKRFGLKLSWTLFTTKIIGMAVKDQPYFNSSIRCGKLIKRDQVDLSVLVNVNEKNLAKKLIRDVDKKDFKILHNELYSSAKAFREGKDKEFNKQIGLLKNLPSYVISVIVEIMSFLSNIGLQCKALGLEKNNFGTLMITSVGGAMKIDDGYAPLLGFTHTVGVITLCAIKTKNILQLDGSYKKEEILTINASLDHRYVDGVLGAKLNKEAKKIFDDPFKYLE